jgi:hypothetical protein
MTAATAVASGSLMVVQTNWSSAASRLAGWCAGASARAALRTWPIVMAASSPCPATSPTTSISRPPGSGMASYQSPPMPWRASAGR